jgi:hypothetical protein
MLDPSSRSLELGLMTLQYSIVLGFCTSRPGWLGAAAAVLSVNAGASTVKENPGDAL